MIFFWLAKALFLMFNWKQSSQLSGAELLGIFGYGMKMDISMSCYLLILPGLLLAFRLFLPSGFVSRFVWVYTLVILFVASFLTVLDLGLYPHWGIRVNVTAFNYINDPVAMGASVSITDVLQGVLITGILLVGFGLLYRRFFPEGFAVDGKISWAASFLQLFLVATLIIPIRGGFDTAPLNLSSVAFSPKLYVNQAASNYLWNFAKSVEKRDRLNNPCVYMPQDESMRLFNQFQEADTLAPRPQLIKLHPEKQPNVILIILESFSNKVISPLGGLKGIAPNLDSLCTKSTVFTNFYSTGNRSDRGISAVLGGYPSLLNTSIMV